ncbi:MAG: fibronectin type III domain-containing protein, partial [Acidimicrobiales bacterium]
MRSTIRLGARALVLAGLVAAATVVTAAPASAHATVSLRSPGVGQRLTAASGTVSASVSLGTHPTGGTEVSKVDMTIDQVGTNRSPIEASATPSGGNVSFPFNLPYNGRYRVSVRAAWSHTGLVLGESTGTANDGPRDFVVVAPPASPTDVKVAVDATARSVTVTWKPNAEPDMLFYVVQRAKGTSNEFTVLGKATEAKFVDASTAEAGGDYRYQVVAVRAGATEEEGISSDPSGITAESTAKVPDPPPPPTTA